MNIVSINKINDIYKHMEDINTSLIRYEEFFPIREESEIDNTKITRVNLKNLKPISYILELYDVAILNDSKKKSKLSELVHEFIKLDREEVFNSTSKNIDDKDIVEEMFLLPTYIYYSMESTLFFTSIRKEASTAIACATFYIMYYLKVLNYETDYSIQRRLNSFSEEKRNEYLGRLRSLAKVNNKVKKLIGDPNLEIIGKFNSKLNSSNTNNKSAISFVPYFLHILNYIDALMNLSMDIIDYEVEPDFLDERVFVFYAMNGYSDKFGTLINDEYKEDFLHNPFYLFDLIIILILVGSGYSEIEAKEMLHIMRIGDNFFKDSGFYKIKGKSIEDSDRALILSTIHKKCFAGEVTPTIKDIASELSLRKLYQKIKTEAGDNSKRNIVYSLSSETYNHYVTFIATILSSLKYSELGNLINKNSNEEKSTEEMIGEYASSNQEFFRLELGMPFYILSLMYILDQSINQKNNPLSDVYVESVEAFIERNKERYETDDFTYTFIDNNILLSRIAEEFDDMDEDLLDYDFEDDDYYDPDFDDEPGLFETGVYGIANNSVFVDSLKTNDNALYTDNSHNIKIKNNLPITHVHPDDFNDEMDKENGINIRLDRIMDASEEEMSSEIKEEVFKLIKVMLEITDIFDGSFDKDGYKIRDKIEQKVNEVLKIDNPKDNKVVDIEKKIANKQLAEKYNDKSVKHKYNKHNEDNKASNKSNYADENTDVDVKSKISYLFADKNGSTKNESTKKDSVNKDTIKKEVSKKASDLASLDELSKKDEVNKNNTSKNNKSSKNDKNSKKPNNNKDDK